jgi:transcriptional regulator with XRE-family HTH domain
MDVRARIGWNLRRLRKERNITQENFATDSGFDRGYISGIERGVRNPSVLVLARIAKALEVDVSALIDIEKAREFPIETRNARISVGPAITRNIRASKLKKRS